MISKSENDQQRPRTELRSDTHTIWFNVSSRFVFWVRNSIVFFWLLTESDFWTFAIPNTAFGILSAFAGPLLTTKHDPNVAEILSRVPRILAWNWLNLVIFDLANQRSPEAVIEDTLNKPWRPIPRGQITPLHMRWILLAALPVVFGANYLLGAWQESAVIIGLTWMYNDLKGAEESFVLRNTIISAAFGWYNGGSLRLACGAEDSLNAEGVRWVCIISGVIFSTMHIQDLKDQTGDRARGRKSAPLVLGDIVARWTIAVPLLVWSVVCPLALVLPFFASLPPSILGTLIACRTLWMRGVEADRNSWYFWVLWLVSLYILPLFKDCRVFSDTLIAFVG